MAVDARRPRRGAPRARSVDERRDVGGQRRGVGRLRVDRGAHGAALVVAEHEDERHAEHADGVLERAEHRVGDDLAGVAHHEQSPRPTSKMISADRRESLHPKIATSGRWRWRARCGDRRPDADAAARRRRSARCRDGASPPRLGGVAGRSVGCSLTAGPLGLVVDSALRVDGGDEGGGERLELLGVGRAEQHERAAARLGGESVPRVAHVVAGRGCRRASTRRRRS